MICYCTFEDVIDALEEKASAFDLSAIKRAVVGATVDVDDAAQLSAGSFRPTIATRYFEWPSFQSAHYYRLWLDANRLLSVTTLTSGGVTIPSADYFLEPQQYGPPYDRIEIDLSGSSSFTFDGTPQRAIEVVGLWGVEDQQEDAGTLAGAISGAVASLIVSNGSLVGIGDQLIIGTERLTVTARSWVAVTSGTTAGVLAASAADRTLAVADGTRFSEGELILVGSERMLITDIAGNNLTVLRARDGSVLATHAALLTIYARRSLTVSRGDYGSTAAAHSDGLAILRHVVPGAAHELAVAHSVSTLLAERRGYTVQSGTPTSGKVAPASLDELRERIASTYGRPVRARVI